MWRLLRQEKCCVAEVRLFTTYLLQTLLPPTWYRGPKWVTMQDFSQCWYAIDTAKKVNADISFKPTREELKRPSWARRRR